MVEERKWEEIKKGEVEGGWRDESIASLDTNILYQRKAKGYFVAEFWS